MNPYNHLGTFDNQITQMQSDLRYSKSKTKDLRQINKLITARNAFESLLKDKYYTDVIETLILDKMLTTYREAKITEGGDINFAESNFMMVFKNMFALGSKAKRAIVEEELKVYSDFHAIREGDWSYETKTDDELNAYLKIRDELVKEKIEERISTIKEIIIYNQR